MVIFVSQLCPPTTTLCCGRWKHNLPVTGVPKDVLCGHMDWLSWFKTITGWFPDKYKTMFAFSFIAALLLFLPWNDLVAMRISDFAANHREMEWLVFLFGSVLLVLSGMENGHKFSRTRRAIFARLDNLSSEERETIRALFFRVRGGIIAWPYEGRVIHLHKDGIVWRSDVDKLTSGMFVYGLNPVVRTRLKKHPERYPWNIIPPTA